MQAAVGVALDSAATATSVQVTAMSHTCCSCARRQRRWAGGQWP